MNNVQATRKDELDYNEMEDVAKCLDKNYSPHKFRRDWDRFVKLKAYIAMRRAKTAARKRLN